jgi:hypothetical protein
MQSNLHPAKIAGLLSLLAAALASVPWYILLFFANPPHRSLSESILGQLTYTFSAENSDRWWFVWFAALPIVSAAVGVAYLCRLANSHNGAVLLLSLNVLLAGAALVFTTWSLAFFIALPIIWGWRCIHGT